MRWDVACCLGERIKKALKCQGRPSSGRGGGRRRSWTGVFPPPSTRNRNPAYAARRLTASAAS